MRSVEFFCSRVLEKMGASASFLVVTFVGPRKIQSLNRNYRGRDYPTDVLSFSYRRESEGMLRFMGEIVIAPLIAEAQARRLRVSSEREIRKLIVHGILHLMGYDHETDRGEMKLIQNRLMRSKSLARCDSLVGSRQWK